MRNRNTPAAWNRVWKQAGFKLPEQAPVNERKHAVAQYVPPGASVLDVACGAAQISRYLGPSIRYVGLDFSSAALLLSPAPGILADVRQLPIKSKSLSVVIAMEILEHIQSEYLFIRSLVRIARNLVVITVPRDRLGPGATTFHLRKYDRFSLYDRIHAAVIVQDILITQTENNLIARIVL